MAKSEPVDARSKPKDKESFHWWDREFFLDNMGALLERLQDDDSLIPCVRVQKTESGDETLWFYTQKKGEGGELESLDDDEGGGFNNSHNCPPFCPGP